MIYIHGIVEKYLENIFYILSMIFMYFMNGSPSKEKSLASI